MEHGGKREGSGRKPLFDKIKIIGIRLPELWIKIIPGNKSEWIRDSVKERLEKEKLI